MRGRTHQHPIQPFFSKEKVSYQLQKKEDKKNDWRTVGLVMSILEREGHPYSSVYAEKTSSIFIRFCLIRCCGVHTYTTDHS